MNTVAQVITDSKSVVSKALVQLRIQFGDDPRLSEAKLLDDLFRVGRVLEKIRSEIVNTPLGDRIDLFSDEDVPSR